MTTNLHIGDPFPDAELPDHNGQIVQLARLPQPGEMDHRLGFHEGYPLIIVFYRGFFCPRDKQQMRQLVAFQDELAVSYCRMVSIAVQPPIVQAAFRAGLGAKWSFLCDVERELINEINILDTTEGEYADPAQPYTFVLRPDMTIHNMYPGWYFVGRPTLHELRQDVRAIMQTLPYYPYSAWDTPEAKKLRIPQSEWVDGAPELGASGLPVAEGMVDHFDSRTGNGTIITSDGIGIFFNFTAIPGEGYRIITPGTRVRFEIVETTSGLSARNIQRL